MSHFTVLVIWDNPEKQLAPFQENNMDDCPKEYLKYCVYDKDWNKHRFDTEEDFKKSWIIPEDEDWGYRENPNAKWDYYQLWGRWIGAFKLKPNVDTNSYSRSEPSFFCSSEQIESSSKEGRCDQAHKGEIDLEFMYQEELKEKIKAFSWVFEHYENKIPIVHKKWKNLVEEYSDDINKAREIYNNQKEVIDFNSLCEEKQRFFCKTLLEDFEWFTSVEEYAQSICSWFSTFAVIKDGMRYEKGEMGRWGTVSNQKDSKTRQSEFKKLLEEVPEDTLLSVYDCHI